MEQGNLAFILRQDEVSDAQVMRCSDMRSAIRFCIDASGLQIKEVAFLMGLHKDHLNRMVNASDDPRHFPPDLIPRLMEVCHNQIPLRWLAMSSGYGLHRLKSAVEEENERLKAEVDRLQRDRDVIIQFMREAKP